MTIIACPHCSEEVNVVCFDGAKLRCGCGKTYADNPAFRRPVLNDDGGLNALLTTLRAHNVKRYRAGEVEIEIDLSSPSIRVETQQAGGATILAEPEICDCGHDVDQHTDAGCMIASCDPAVCEAWAGKREAVA